MGPGLGTGASLSPPVSEGCPEAPILPHLALCSVRRDVLAGARAGCPSRVCLSHRTHLDSVLSLPDMEPPWHHAPSSAQLLLCPGHRAVSLPGQEKLCWCPLEGQQVPAWCTEPEDRVLSFPNSGYPAVLQALCNPVGRFAPRGHF